MRVDDGWEDGKMEYPGDGDDDSQINKTQVAKTVDDLNWLDDR
jgi:hypothetical protein